MRSTEIDGVAVHVLGVVKGLVSEKAKVRDAILSLDPDVVGLSISAEELEALKVKEDYSKYEMSTLEEVYAVYLESFGPVELPTPAYVEAMELCAEKHIELVALDLSDAEYTEAYCENIGAMEIVRESFFSRSISRKRFNISSPEQFALDWDRKVNRAKGFRELEERREAHMAEELNVLAKAHKKVLAVIEIERADGVLARIEPS